MAKKSGDGSSGKTPDGKTGVKENKSMANSLIKGLAITLGGGLAVGLGIKIGQSSAPPALRLSRSISVRFSIASKASKTAS